ncbi:MAG: hypothetical protein HY943_20335 [Gammaproteobacteria bacterium]|nr:hypothetical protein [Gammaproteobacteria bacterium]
MAADRHPVRVELVGFDERHRATLDVLFQGPGKGACTIVAGGHAQAAIIDVDRIGGLAGWEDYRRTHPHAPTAIVSIYDKNRVEGEIFLRKPVKIDDMLYAVAAIRARLLGTAAPTARAEPVTTSAFTRSAADPKSETVWPQAVPRSVLRARAAAAGDTPAAPQPVAVAGPAARPAPRPVPVPAAIEEPITRTRMMASAAARAAANDGARAAPPSEPATATRRHFGVAARSSAVRVRIPDPERATQSVPSRIGAGPGLDPQTFAPQLAALGKAAREAQTALSPHSAVAASAPAVPVAPLPLAVAPTARDGDKSVAIPPPLSAGPLPVAPPTTTPEERALCGSATDIDCMDARAVEGLWFDAEQSPYAAVRTAIRNAQRDRGYWLLVHEGRTLLCADGVRQEVILHVPKDEIRRLCAEEGQAGKATMRRVTQALGAGLTLPIEAVLWEMALWTYRGRLPAGTDLAQRVKLTRWPNFTRLIEIPESLRIAAILSQQALTLPFVAEALHVPQRYVFAFYGAAHALGIAEKVQREVPAALVPDAEPEAEPPTVNVFTRMWARVRGLFGHVG